MGPDGLAMEGCIMRLADLPPKLPHYIAEVYSDCKVLINETLLAPEQLLRDEQAADEFSVRAGNHAKDNGGLKIDLCKRAPSFKTLVKLGSEVHEKRKAALIASANADKVGVNPDQEGGQALRSVKTSGSRFAAARVATVDLCSTPSVKKPRTKRSTSNVSGSASKKTRTLQDDPGAGRAAGKTAECFSLDGGEKVDASGFNKFSIADISEILRSGVRLGRSLNGVQLNKIRKSQ
jgi:hypothetical protein